MKTTLKLVSLATIAAVCAAALLGGTPALRILDRRAARYLENERTGRAIAAVEATLLGGDGQARLEMVLSAVDPLVDPAPGFRGVRGANHLTAREMDDIARERRLRVRTRTGDAVTAGRWHAGRRGRVPVRRLVRGRDATGGARIVYDGLSERAYVVELVASSGSLWPGKHRTEILVDGRTRLRVTFEVGADGGRIETIESLDQHPAQELAR